MIRLLSVLGLCCLPGLHSEEHGIVAEPGFNCSGRERDIFDGWAKNNSKSYDSEEETEIAFLATTIVQPVSFAFMATLVVATLLEKAKISFIPESALIILVGAILGYVLHSSGLLSGKALLEANAPLVNMLFLPLIIFESGYSLRKMDFAAQFLYILVFAVIGTAIATLTVGSLIYATSEFHGISNMRTAFTYASLIAATDPVATLSTYSSLRVEPLLHIFVFGESTINDAVAIVLFDIMNSQELFGPADALVRPSMSQLLECVLQGIGQKLIGSICVGVGLALCYTLVLKFGDMKHAPSFEILFIVSSCFLTFSTAERLHMSGIIAVLFCGMFMGIYSKPHLSLEGGVLASFFIKETATIADMGVFFLVGVDLILLNGTSLKFSLWVMLFCLIGRAVSTTFCGLVVNGTKRACSQNAEKTPLMLSRKHLFMMWHAGLRGGIALVLCLELGPWVDKVGGAGTKQELINTTIVVILVFLLVFGGTTECCLNALGIKMGVEVEEGYLYDKSLTNSVHRCFERIHRSCLVPLLYPVDEGDDADSVEHGKTLRQAIYDLVSRHRGHYWFRKEASTRKELDSEEEDDGEYDSE
eukprot:TRINITY_DN38049_c0_g1_i1.p1 TRINITY_DN38049_c0_g1~~TRINITY_DN38049_c0_g1_i1.p1  ORF type:complete len:588 (+),score=135.69 TRINITY_DN38049_c0_g1_i1:64-1827(+)